MIQPRFALSRSALKRVGISFLAALGAALLFLIVVALRDERIGGREILFAAAGFVGVFAVSMFLLRNVDIAAKENAIAASGAVAVALGVMIFRLIPLPAQLFLLTGVQAEILDLEPETEIELYWAYWSDGISKDGEDTPRSLRDISYNDFSATGSWTVSEAGILRTDEKGAALRFLNLGPHDGFPVLSFRTIGGDALIVLRQNGKRSFYSINGNFTDPTPVFGRHALRLHRVAAFSAETIAIGSVLFPILAALTVRLFQKNST